MAKLRGLAKGCGLIVAGGAALIVVALIALFVWAHFVGPPTPLPAPKTAAERVARNLKVFDAVWEDINRHYYDRTFHGRDWEAVRRAFRPKAAAAVSDGELYLQVLAPMTAELNDSHTKIFPGGTADFRVPKQAPPEMSPEAHTLPDGIVVLRVNRFDVGDGAWLMARLRSAPTAGVILDLRHNTGGAITILRAAAGVLEGPGRPLGTTRDARGRHMMRSRSLNFLDQLAVSDFKTPTSFRYRGPLVVLVGPASVSAAEILARSLRVNGRAVLVGERTAGAVLVARNYDLPDGGTVQVPVQDFEDSTGQRLETRGVTPDVFALQTLEAIRSDRDLVVEAADAAMLRARILARNP